jgi:hypothetical protein
VRQTICERTSLIPRFRLLRRHPLPWTRRQPAHYRKGSLSHNYVESMFDRSRISREEGYAFPSQINETNIALSIAMGDPGGAS